MKQLITIVTFVIITLILINYFWFVNLEKYQVNYQKELISKKARNVGNDIEKTISDYQNDLTKILFKNARLFPELFSDKIILNSVISDLKNLYSKYRNLISNISAYDNENRYLSIYIKDNDEFVLDTFPRQSVNNLTKKDTIVKRNGYYVSYFPYFKNNELFGNVEVEINLNKYLKNALDVFLIPGIEWQWLLSNSGQIIFINQKDSININNLNKISDSLINENEFVFEHSYSSNKLKDQKIISAVYPLNVLNNDLGIVFSVETSGIINGFLKRNLNILIVDLFAIVSLIIFLLYRLNKTRISIKNKMTELDSLKMIFTQLPVGVMIQDELGTLKYINKTAQRMLFLDEDKNYIGKTLSNQFLISNKFLLKDGLNLPFDANHFIHYEKDDNEIVIYRRDVKTNFSGEEVQMSALIDVTALEKSRRQESAANIAKSDFLAKMSHEIRTPMNGIISISDILLRENLTKNQIEEVQIIKRSSELLLNIINEILDFSKIEAGKMMLEEIPFSLNEELNHSLELLKPLATEKNLEFIIDIKSDVPDSLIGDPFRLRQVISNLVSNAIKFTQKGKIVLEISLVERNISALTILFSIADTGIGISKEEKKRIFSSYEQVKRSVSREYGGTGLGTAIAKQLIEMMNGEIWVESPSGVSENNEFPGTRVNFSIEVHSNEKLKKDYDFSKIRQFQQVSVLILYKIRDKDDSIHHFLDQLGINFNYRICDDSAFDNVIQYIQQKKDLYQVIIIMDKPDYSGFIIAQGLKENHISEYLPIIMVSSNDQKGNYLRCKNLDIDYYLIQPFESIELYNILREIFPGVSYLKGMMNKIREDLKILVVEDNIINQRIVQNIFKHLGFEIELAQNGKEAVELTTEKRFDIIFMDILMPEMDGISAIREIRKKDKELTIIALSANEDPMREKRASEAGANGYIAKPVKVEEIKQLLISMFSESI